MGIINMKILLVTALIIAATAEPTVERRGGRQLFPGFYGHPVALAPPVVYASNTCKNEAGNLVPCNDGVVPGSSIYAFNAHPLPHLVPAAAPAGADGVVDVEKREAEAEAEPEAEADPYLLYANYYGTGSAFHHPYYYGYGGYGYYGHPYGYYGYYGK